MWSSRNSKRSKDRARASRASDPEASEPAVIRKCRRVSRMETLRILAELPARDPLFITYPCPGTFRREAGISFRIIEWGVERYAAINESNAPNRGRGDPSPLQVSCGPFQSL